MYGDQIEAILRQDPYAKKCFGGVFAADELPTHVPKPYAIVMNNQKRHQAGEHWTAAFIDQAGNGLYFDSYGRSPVVKEHRQFMVRECVSWRYNTQDLQSLFSTVCGQYCIYFLMHCTRGLSLTDFVWHFCPVDTVKNDEFVKDMFPLLVSARLGQRCRARRCQ